MKKARPGINGRAFLNEESERIGKSCQISGRSADLSADSVSLKGFELTEEGESAILDSKKEGTA